MTEIGEFPGLVDSRRFDLKRRIQEYLGNTMTIGIAEARLGMWVRHKETGRLGEIIGRGLAAGEFLVQFDPTGKRRHKKRKRVNQFLLERVPEMLVIAEMAK